MRKNVKSGPLLALVLFPLLMLALLKPMMDWRGEFHSYGNFDPEYAYLFNSLSVLHGTTPWHRDHPGTTLQSLGALTLRIAHPSLSRDQIVDLVVRDPERELQRICWVLFLLCAVILFFSGRLVARALGNVWYGALFQGVPLLNVAAWMYVGRVTPDWLVMSLGILLVGLALAVSERLRPYLLGATFAAILATKITGLPLALVPALLLVRKPREAAKAAVTFGAVYLLLVIPLLWNWKNSVAYIMVLPKRLGYGQQMGQSLDVVQWLGGVLGLLVRNPLLALGAVSGSFVVRKRGPWRFLAMSLLLIILSQIVMVTGDTAPRYLLPISGVIALLAVLAFNLFQKRFQLYSMAPLYGAVGLVFLMALAIPLWILGDSAKLRAARLADAVALQTKARELGCDPIASVPSDSKIFGVFFGNNFTDRRFTENLAQVYPDTVLYVPESGFINFEETRLNGADVARKQKGPLCVQARADATMPNGYVPALKTETSDSLYVRRGQ